MTDTLSDTFAALADPTRRAILSRLAGGEISAPAISRHLKVLENAGLIERGRNAQWRPCRLNPEPLKDANAWIETYKEFWTRSFDRLDDYLKEMQEGNGDGRKH